MQGILSYFYIMHGCYQLCFMPLFAPGSQKCTTYLLRAINCDPDNIIYNNCWSMMSGSANANPSRYLFSSRPLLATSPYKLASSLYGIFVKLASSQFFFIHGGLKCGIQRDGTVRESVSLPLFPCKPYPALEPHLHQTVRHDVKSDQATKGYLV